MNNEFVIEQTNPIAKVFRAFALSLGVSVLGFVAGQFVPTGFMLPLNILLLIMIIAAFAVRKSKAMSYGFLFAFTFIMGITLYPTIAYYVSDVGAGAVVLAFGTTTLIFTTLSVYGLTTKRDFSFMGGFLMAGLLAIIAVSLFSIFFPLTSAAGTALAVIGALIFSGYVLYDVNRMVKHGITEEMVPLCALNLYLDFINLFLYILRILDRD